jgi:hypothetical protein
MLQPQDFVQVGDKPSTHLSAAMTVQFRFVLQKCVLSNLPYFRIPYLVSEEALLVTAELVH